MKSNISKSNVASGHIRPNLHASHLVQPILVLLLIITFLLLPQRATGQETPITATVSNTTASTDEVIVLTVVVVDDSPQQLRPILPRLDGLAVIDLDIATDVSMVSGKIQTQVTYTYVLQPRRTGLLTIPPITVKIDSQLYKTSPISIRVSQGAPPAPSPGNAVSPDDISPPANFDGQDFFVEAQVDVPTPYAGQQFIYTFRFYQAIQVYRPPQFESPLFTGFETIGLPVQEYNININDRTYLITEIRTGLFAKKPGSLAIGPARLMLPGNFYEEPIELYTEPIQVEVQTLPGNQPENFYGAVGQYEINSWFSPQVAVVNQPSTLSVALSGVGNIQDLPEPVWPSLEGWRSYSSLTSLTTEMKGDLMTGTRVFERVVIPDQVGDFIIPPAIFAYFDPVAGEYRTITSEPISVKIIPAPTPEPTVIALPTATPAAIAVVNTPAPVAQPIDPAVFVASSSRFVMPLVIVLLLCGVVPMAMIVGAGGVWLWQRQRYSLPVRNLRPEEKPKPKPETLSRPSQSIHPLLAAAMKESDDNYKAVSMALKNYLNDVLQTSINGLTQAELTDRLRQRGLGKALLERLEDCMAQSEMGRFGPSSEDAGWSLMAAADELLFELDKVFKPEA